MLSRREILLGGALSSSVVTKAEAALPALLAGAWRAVSAVSTAWGAVEAGKGVWNLFSEQKREAARTEVSRAVGVNSQMQSGQVINNIYNFSDFDQMEPCGFYESSRKNIYLVSVAQIRPFSLGNGLAIAAERLIRELASTGYDEEKVVAFTRPTGFSAIPRVEEVSLVQKRYIGSYKSAHGKFDLDWLFDAEDYESSYKYRLFDRSGRQIYRGES